MPYPTHRPCPHSYEAVQQVSVEIARRHEHCTAQLLTGDAAVLLDALTEKHGDWPLSPSASDLYAFCPPTSRATYWLAATYLEMWTSVDHSRMIRNGPDTYACAKAIMEAVALYLDGNEHAVSITTNRYHDQHIRGLPGYVQACTWVLTQRRFPMYYPEMLRVWQVYYLIDKIIPQDP